MFKERMEELIKSLKKERKKCGMRSLVFAGLFIGTLAIAFVSSSLSIPALTTISAMVSGTILGFSIASLVETLIANSKVKMATKDKLEYEYQEELYYSKYNEKQKELDNNVEIIQSNEAENINDNNEMISDAMVSIDTTQSNVDYSKDENISDNQTEIEDENYKILQNQSKDKPKDDGREF